MKRILWALVACMIVISCSDKPIETGTKDFRVSVTMLRNKLTSGTAGTVAFRVESNKQTVTVEDFSIVYKQTGESASWINFINFPFGANYTDSHDIQLNSNGYAEFWTEPIEVGTHSGNYEIRVRFYDASTKSYSDTFVLEFVAVGEERAESAGISINCAYRSKTKPYVLSYSLGKPETTMSISVLKSIGGHTYQSGNVGLIVNETSGNIRYINDDELYDRQNVIDSEKDDYSLFIWKENSYSETSSVFKVCPGANYDEAGTFDVYDKDDPSNRVTVTTYLRYPVMLCLYASVGNPHSARCKPKGSLPYKVRSYGWYGTFSTEITASIIALYPVENTSNYVTSIPIKNNSWNRISETFSGSYHLGAEKSDNYDNGFHLWEFGEPQTVGDSDDSFTATVSIVTGWQGTQTSQYYKGDRGADSAQHYNDLNANKQTRPKDNRRDFPVTVAPGRDAVVEGLADAMNYCCDLVTVANNFDTGNFSATAYSAMNGHWENYKFGLDVTSVEYDRDKYDLLYLLEWYRGIKDEDFLNTYEPTKGTGKYGYNYPAGRTVWYEGRGVAPVRDLSKFKNN